MLDLHVWSVVMCGRRTCLLGQQQGQQGQQQQRFSYSISFRIMISIRIIEILAFSFVLLFVLYNNSYARMILFRIRIVLVFVL